MERAAAATTSPGRQPVRRPEELEEKQHQESQGSTTTTYATDYLRDAASWLWATVRRDYSGPQNLMRGFFANDGYSPAQKLDHLVAQWRSLGLSGDGLYAFIEQLVFAPEGAVLKDEFRPIFGEFKAFIGLPEFVQALAQPNTTEGKRVLTSLQEALRTDPAYLAGKTMEAMASRLPIQEKAVHLMLFLNTRGVSDEQARACYAKIPVDQAAFFGEEDVVDLGTVTVGEMQGVVGAKIDPLAVLNVMQSFQAQGFGITVTQLHETMLERDFKRPLLNLQVAVKEEKDKKKVQTEAMDLAASVIPGTAVEYQLFSILGKTFNHFTGCDVSKPCGDVATEALSRMIAEVTKQRAEAEARK